jgi:hypothetical protein
MRQRRIIYIKIIQVGKFLNSKINLELKYAKPELHLSYKCENINSKINLGYKYAKPELHLSYKCESRILRLT